MASWSDPNDIDIITQSKLHHPHQGPLTKTPCRWLASGLGTKMDWYDTKIKKSSGAFLLTSLRSGGLGVNWR